METQAYLDAHGIVCDGKKLIIPAVCEHLTVQNGTPVVYRCQIHSNKFANCRLGGKKECNEAKRCWALLHPSPSPNGGGIKGGGVTKCRLLNPKS
jgi:hypothetical protein